MPPTTQRKGSFRTTAGEGYGDRYMTDEQLAADPRKRRLNEAQQAIIRSMLDALPPNALVADVPCGNGRLTQLVTRPDLTVLPMDYNHVMLQTMTERCPGAPFLPFRVRTDITAMPLPDRCIDLFISFRLLHHVADHATRAAICAEIARVTRGKVIMTYWTTRCWRYIRKRILGKTIRGNPIPPAAFIDACEQGGLIVEHIRRTDWGVEEECVAICRPRSV